jgi:hypothetical protein
MKNAADYIFLYKGENVITELHLCEVFFSEFPEFAAIVAIYPKYFLTSERFTIAADVHKQLKDRFPDLKKSRQSPFVLTESGLIRLFRIFSDQPILDRSLEILEVFVGLRQEKYILPNLFISRLSNNLFL